MYTNLELPELPELHEWQECRKSICEVGLSRVLTAGYGSGHLFW